MAYTEAQLFNKYFNGGKYALPYLLEFRLTSDATEVIRLANNTEDIIYNNNTYTASSFDYVPPDSKGKGATLNISGVDNDLIEFVENADENWRLDVIGVIAEDGSVTAVKQYVHFLGSVSYDQNMELQFQLGTDDRLDMDFPPYKFDTETNQGNT